MATVQPQMVWTQKGVCKVTWTGLTETNADGAPFDSAHLSDKSIHIKGTFGAGGTCLCEGSNDGATYVTLTDPQGNAISKTAEAIEQILENVVFTRPRVSAGTGVSLTVIMVGKGTG